MRTPSTSALYLRSLIRNKRISLSSRHNRYYSTLALLLTCLVLAPWQTSNAKPFAMAASTDGPTGWASPQVATLPNVARVYGTDFPSDQIPMALRIAMANQSAPTEVIDLEETVEIVDETPTTVGTTWCNNVRGQDQIYVINARSVGSCCDPGILQKCLRCQRFEPCVGCCGEWQDVDLMEVLSQHDPTVTTVFYVHGNRVSSGTAMARCRTVYRRMLCCADSDRPIRFIAFSWPSAQIPGLLRDVRVKAARTRPAGCQLAWVLDQMPGDQQIGLIGFSFGARVITGALHILDGGHLSGMCLSKHVHPQRQPFRVVMIAAATHAHWLGQGQYHGQALYQVDKMLSINNNSDMAMQWYHLSSQNGSPQAMGLCGPTCLGHERHKVRNRNVARCVGSEHNFRRYLSAPGVACDLWQVAAWGR